MDIIPVFGTVVGGSNPSESTCFGRFALKGLANLARLKYNDRA